MWRASPPPGGGGGGAPCRGPPLPSLWASPPSAGKTAPTPALPKKRAAPSVQPSARGAARRGRCSDGLVAQQDELLAAYGLPGKLHRVKVADVLAAIPRDKKAVRGTVGWVLPRTLGRAETGRAVPAELVEEVVTEVL